MTEDDLAKIFSASLTPPSRDARARMLTHAGLLEKWNRTHNLTSLQARDWAEVHFFDSWLLEPLAREGQLFDVGSGGGFPGLVLLSASPDRAALFFEKVEKKRAFLRTAIAALGYQHARVAESPFPPETLGEERITFVSRATWAPAEWLEVAARIARCGDSVITQSAAEAAPPAPTGWRRSDLVESTLPLAKAARTLARFVREA